MSPTVLRDGPFRLFFFSREEERMHVHVMADAEAVVRRHEQEVQNAWKRHFGR